jgi:hypothetical protein
VCEPLRGWREVAVERPRTRLDWAACVKALGRLHYPDRREIVLVMDNLNIHSPASLYEAFPPAEANRRRPCWNIQHTPKHGAG